MNTRTRPVPLGTVVATAGVLDTIPAIDLLTALCRHEAGDWGQLCDEDWMANELSLVKGGRLLSAYASSAGGLFWIVTEADRTYTTLLLPEEY